jgi:hypothetical protein
MITFFTKCEDISDLFSPMFQPANKQMMAAHDEGLESLKDYIYSKMWYPDYRPLVYLPPGKGE